LRTTSGLWSRLVRSGQKTLASRRRIGCELPVEELARASVPPGELELLEEDLPGIGSARPDGRLGRLSVRG
jgi:hypothetical protein